MRRLGWVLSGIATLGIAAISTAVAFPLTRHVASALWNSPDRLPALEENTSIHFEPGAEAYAREVLVLLPRAVARVEAAQGRPFAHPVTIGVYHTLDAYAAANASGIAGAVGLTAFGRTILSPTLYFAQHRRLPAILTHELSHAHLQGWMSPPAFYRLPVWFKEGLAVAVSNGGGAEFVGEDEALAAIQNEHAITLETTGSILRPSEIRFDDAPADIKPSHRTVMAYRQAGMFIQWLRRSDSSAFAKMIDRVLNNEPLSEAVNAAYGSDLEGLWTRFVSGRVRDVGAAQPPPR